MEAYLTFHYIFTNENNDLSVYRHKVWKLGGLIDRSKFFASTPENIQKLAQEQQYIDKLKGEIRSSAFFIRNNEKNLMKGKWKPDEGWNKLGTLAGFHETYFKDIYSHLCGHAHASYISAIQIRDANNTEDQKALAASARNIGCLILAHFAFAYIKLFPAAEVVLRRDAELYRVADKWNIRKEDVEFIYGKPN